MTSLTDKADLLKLLLAERDAMATALRRMPLTTSWQTVHRLKNRYEGLSRRLTRLQKDLEPHAAGLARTNPELPALLMRVRRDFR